MPSIRRSLILYFLLLLGVTLGTVALLVDQYARDFSKAREAAEAGRIETEYEVGRAEIEEQFDNALDLEAEDLGKSLRWKFFVLGLREWEARSRASERDQAAGRSGRDRNRERDFEESDRRYRLTKAYGHLASVGSSAWLGVIQTPEGPSRGLRDSLGAAGGSQVLVVVPPPDAQVRRLRELLLGLLRIHQDDELVRRSYADGDDHPKHFVFQIPARYHWRVIPSPHPNTDLPIISPDELSRPTAVYPRFENVTVGGETLRHVIIKAPLGGIPFRSPLTEMTRKPEILAVVGTAPVAVPMSVQLNPAADPLPFVYVQCARPKAELDAKLAEHADERDEKLAVLNKQTRLATTRLRMTIALIAAVAFAAMAIGGWLLVGRGVAPVRKLSEAVSRVTERDFRLPVDRSELSVELAPIHDRLTQTLDELRRAFDREKQAIADISHELRTPVAALLTTLDVSLRKPRAADQYRQTLEECRTITRQLGQLVERVMTLAYLDAGQTRVSMARVPAAEVADGCATVIRPLAEARGLSFALKADPAAELDTDPDKLREVLMNLLHNAVEYSNPGGSVELVVRNGGDRVAFDVRDTGIGMSGDVKDRIFERFYRADPSRTETGVHAGLGLAIVKEYVERLGGSISVESAPGKGSLFRVELPAAKVEEELPQLAT